MKPELSQLLSERDLKQILDVHPSVRILKATGESLWPDSRQPFACRRDRLKGPGVSDQVLCPDCPALGPGEEADFPCKSDGHRVIRQPILAGDEVVGHAVAEVSEAQHAVEAGKAVASVASWIGLLLQREIPVYLSKAAIEKMCDAISVEAVQDNLFDAVLKLCSPLGVRLWVLGEQSIDLVRQEGQQPRSEEIEDGDDVCHDRKARAREAGKLVTWTVPIVWLASESPAAFQVVGDAGQLRERNRQAIQIMTAVASNAMVRVAAGSALGSFKTKLLSGRAPWEALRMRRQLFQEAARVALRISGANVSHVGIDVDDKLRIAGTDGAGWTQDRIEFEYAKSEKSLGWLAINLGQPVYSEDTTLPKWAGGIYPTFGTTKSAYVAPFIVADCKGVIGVDWDKPNGLTDTVRSDLTRLVREVQEVLQEIDEREQDLFRQIDAMAGPQSSDAELASGVARLVRRWLNARSASVFARETGDATLKLLASTEDTETKLEPIIEPDNSPSGWVFRNGRALRMTGKGEVGGGNLPREVTSRDPWEEESASPERVGAFLAAPLFAGNVVIGILRVSGRADGGSFTDEEEGFLRQVASRIARALNAQREERRLVEQIRARKREAKNTPGSSHELYRACQATAAAVLAGTHADNAYLVVHAAPDISAEVAAGLAFNALMANDVAIKAPLSTEFLSAIAPDSAWAGLNDKLAGFYGGRPPTRLGSLASIPLRFEDENCSGTLILSWATKQEFTDDHRQSVEAAAQQEALVLEPTLNLHRRNKRQEALRETGLGLAVSIESDKLMENVVTTSLQWSGLDYGTIRLFDDKEDAWILKAPLDEPRDKMYPALKTDDYPIIRRSAGERDPRHVPDTRDDELWKEMRTALREKYPDGGPHWDYLEKNVCSVHVPIWLDAKCIGIIFLHCDKPKNVTRETLDYLAILAQYVAVVTAIAREQELSKPIAMMGSMMNGFLHFMRNKINNSLGISDLLLKHSQVQGRDLQRIRNLDNYLVELNAVCEDLSRFSGAASVRNKSVLDMNAIVERSLASFSKAEWPKIEIVYNSAIGSNHVVANERLLEMAFKMIILNALEAMGTKGTLTVTSERSSSAAVMRFRDTGVGMDVDTKKRCMIPFFSTKGERGGTGMGLAVVQGIVKSHQGTVEIETAPGEGSEFKLTFPPAKGK